MDNCAVDYGRSLTRICIERDRDGKKQNTAWPQDTKDLGKRLAIIGYVLEHLRRRANVKGGRGECEALNILHADATCLGAQDLALHVLRRYEGRCFALQKAMEWTACRQFVHRSCGEIGYLSDKHAGN
jgi:hypothetical protein